MRYWYLFALFLSSFAVFGQSIQGFHFCKSKQRRYQTKFELYNNLIIVPALINEGADTLNFVLDTGAGPTVILDTTFIKKLNINKSSRILKVRGGGGEASIKAYVAPNNWVKIGEMQSLHQELVVLSEDVFFLSNYAGIKVHGIIGHDLFRRFIVKIDYGKRELEFIKHPYFKLSRRLKKYTLPIQVENERPYVNDALLRMSDEDRTELPLKLLVDTGAGHSLSLEVVSDPAITVPEKKIITQLGMTISGVIEGAIGRVSAFKIGKYEFDQVIASFPDSSTFILRDEGIWSNGSVGVGLLSRFTVYVDYQAERLTLVPNKMYDDPFEYSLSGITIVAMEPDYNVYKIVKVFDNSPAEAAGLKVGDVFISINEKPAAQLSISEIYAILDKKKGIKTKILVERGKGVFYTTLTSRSFF